ncbi:hypothetical protein LCGC14_2078580 [marine sediment metagenome]|uniref:Uncharacterized protein n=1 Tax=marine sediment metagenome TaxID=412755 RepID=A0A0F9F3L5_9ZZZZ
MTEASSASDGGDQEIDTQAGDTGDTEISGASDTSAEGAKPDVTDPASSSTADGKDPDKGSDDQSPPTMIEAVEAALEKGKEDAGSSPDESGKDAQAEAADAEDKKSEDKGDEAGEDDKLLPFHDHPRFRELIAERNDLKEKVESASEAEEAILRVETVLKEQNLSVDEFNRTLSLAGLVKNDPAKALEAIEPLYNRLREITGNVLPADIKQQVEQGYMTEGAGLELAKARAQTQAAEFREQTQSHRSTQEREQRQQSDLVDGVSRAATDWENEWKANDPDYSVKAPRVLERIELKVLKGEFPADPVKAREMCETVKKEVEAELRAFLPKKDAITANQTGSSKGKGSTAQEPKTYEEAVLAAL